ncbi:hypothetical protein BD410DRAFT_806474 [Rickenella mellea]|uniref:Uncharacterized protein n=1 Tax=Rickenella mellea TaxID=50990 RepID=A0A4Y7PV38_9AGAM|nr:hypothetical protein BD410DRAFT_806474 [Rickenella mellea]
MSRVFISPSTTTSSASRRHPRPFDHPQHRENIPKDVGYQNLQFSWPFRAWMDGIEGGDHREDSSEDTMALATSPLSECAIVAKVPKCQSVKVPKLHSTKAVQSTNSSHV